MGVAASLFHSTADPTNCLDWRIRPSDEQYDAQKRRWNLLRDYLREDLAIRSDCNVSSWLQGSYKFATQIRPASKSHEFDIDLGVYFQWAGQPEEGPHEPADLKEMVQASLQDYAQEKANDASGVDDPHAKCSRIHFENDFHIDVPAYHLDAARDARMLAIAKNGWQDSDPKAIYKWWKTITGTIDRARCRRLVRYLKMWTALKVAKDCAPSSILLTVLVADAFDALDTAELSGDDEFLREIVRRIVSRLKASFEVENPANTCENLNRMDDVSSEEMLEKFEEFLSTADRALAAPTKTESADIWSELFDHFFPRPTEDDAEEAVLKEDTGRSIARISFDPIIKVRATTGEHVYEGVDKIGPIPKDCELHFALANGRDLPRGAIVDWIVRNAGTEAEQENDLGHRSGDGLTQDEHSAYKGKHFMDVSVRLNGALIGSKRVPVLVMGVRMPARTPPRRRYP